MLPKISRQQQLSVVSGRQGELATFLPSFGSFRSEFSTSFLYRKFLSVVKLVFEQKMSRNRSKRRRETASELEDDGEDGNSTHQDDEPSTSSAAAKRSRKSNTPEQDDNEEDSNDTDDEMDCTQPELHTNAKVSL